MLKMFLPNILTLLLTPPPQIFLSIWICEIFNKNSFWNNPETMSYINRKLQDFWKQFFILSKLNFFVLKFELGANKETFSFPLKTLLSHHPIFAARNRMKSNRKSSFKWLHSPEIQSTINPDTHTESAKERKRISLD